MNENDENIVDEIINKLKDTPEKFTCLGGFKDELYSFVMAKATGVGMIGDIENGNLRIKNVKIKIPETKRPILKELFKTIHNRDREILLQKTIGKI